MVHSLSYNLVLCEKKKFPYESMTRLYSINMKMHSVWRVMLNVEQAGTTFDGLKNVLCTHGRKGVRVNKTNNE